MDARPEHSNTLAMCVGKEPFSTPQLAKKVMRRRLRRRLSYAAQQHVYRCPSCGLFHIGQHSEARHTAKPRKRRAAAFRREDDEDMG